MDEKNSSSRPIEREIRCTLATLRVNSQTGWKRLVTVTRWGGQTGRFKLDIRDWSEDMSRSTKGLTMNRGEVEKLRNILSIMDMSLIDDAGYTGSQYEKPAQTRFVPSAPVKQAEVPEVQFGNGGQQSAPVQNTQPAETEPVETASVQVPVPENIQQEVPAEAADEEQPEAIAV